MMRPDLAALVVHDLKNALGALESQLETLADHPDTALARRSWQYCRELRQRFVMFLSLYGIDGDMRAQVTDESPLGNLEHVCRAASTLEDGGAPIELGPLARSAPPFWFFDRRLVRLALEAALHNARRYARGRIVLDVREEDGCLVFSVDDDGPGLGAPAVNGEEHATGLGTALCHAVAHAHRTTRHDGRVNAGQPPGRGCAVRAVAAVGHAAG